MSCRVTLLGATGSVGKAAAEFLHTHRDDYQAVAITGHRNVARLHELAILLEPELAVIADESCRDEMQQAFAGTKTRIAVGIEGVREACTLPADKVLAAIVGSAGLQPTLWAAEQGAEIALANKECLVMAGEFLLKTAKKILPVDSEHNAIFQVLSDNRDEVKKLILTSSGGPLQNLSRAEMADVTPEQAAQHPNWSMGTKISIDSATMMNKALELIEAHYLFAMPADRLEVLIHPQQIIHSMVHYCDGSILAQLGVTDMYLPVAHALSYPKRYKSAERYHLNFHEHPQLDFRPPDPERFPALRLAREVLRTGQNAPIVFNAANEAAVTAFAAGQIPFLAIADIIEQCLQQSEMDALLSLDDVFAMDVQSRNLAKTLIAKHRI